MGYFKNIILNKEEFIKKAARYLCSVKNGAHIGQFVKGLDRLGIGGLIQKYPGDYLHYLKKYNIVKTHV